MQKHYYLLVLGGGSGGLAAAQMAASYGAKVALIERNLIGGTCVNVGCVPKKIMWYAAELAKSCRFAPAYGFQSNPVTLDFEKLVNDRQQYINKLNQNYERRLKDNQIQYLKGSASFSDSHSVLVNGETYTADHIIIATGCLPKKPDIKGAELAIDSNDFFSLKAIPKKIAIVGAGYIAVELASILNQLGSKVSFLLRHDKPLRHFDSFLGTTLVELMTAQGIEILPHHPVQQIERDEQNLLTVHCQAGKSINQLNAVLFAIGRSPLTADLNLEAVKVKTDEEGFIVTDKWEKTNISHIYAIGDVTGKKQLTPVAIAAGRRLVSRIFGNKADSYLDYDNIPTVVFNHPPIGSIGLSEEAAVAKYGEKQISIYKTRFNPLFYSLSEQKIPSAMKLITLKPNDKIIGCHLIGLGADEMLQGFAVAIKMGATKQDFDNTVAIHPTNAEELVTLK